MPGFCLAILGCWKDVLIDPALTLQPSLAISFLFWLGEALLTQAVTKEQNQEKPTIGWNELLSVRGWPSSKQQSVVRAPKQPAQQSDETLWFLGFAFATTRSFTLLACAKQHTLNECAHRSSEEALQVHSQSKERGQQHACSMGSRSQRSADLVSSA